MGQHVHRSHKTTCSCVFRSVMGCQRIFIGRTGAEAEAPIFWACDVKNWLFGKDPDAGKDSRQEEKGTTEDEMVGWHHWLNRHEFEQVPGDGEGQGRQRCCSPWGQKELDKTWCAVLCSSLETPGEFLYLLISITFFFPASRGYFHSLTCGMSLPFFKANTVYSSTVTFFCYSHQKRFSIFNTYA